MHRAIKKMTKVYKKDGSPSKAAIELSASIIRELPRAEGGKIKLHLVGYYGRGRHTTPAYGEHRAALALLDETGIEYVVGNDAPRGGAGGTYIEMSRESAEGYLAMVRE